MSPTRVGVVGCGIAGPVLAIFLKRNGYDPIVYERHDEVVDAGLSLMLQPNGLAVLTQIPEITPGTVPGRIIDEMAHYSATSGTVLAKLDLPTEVRKRFGIPLIGVPRSGFHHFLVETATKYGIPIKWGHHLIDLDQKEDHVVMKFKNGTEDTASFVVGCDGLHSNTRISLFGDHLPDFTGLVQTGGVSPTPEVLKATAAMINVYGVGAHMISYPISVTDSVWAISAEAPEAKEEWRYVDQHKQDEFRSGPASHWPFGAGELVKNSKKFIKYGLYDRPELKTWYSGRVVLLGDAAHPTTPHLGQGANQAMEDIGQLIKGLTTHNPTAAEPSTQLLGTIFAEYEKVRLPRTAYLVKAANQRGHMRVVPDEATALERDEKVKAANSDKAAVLEGFIHLEYAPLLEKA